MILGSCSEFECLGIQVFITGRSWESGRDRVNHSPVVRTELMARKNPRRNIARIEVPGEGRKIYGGWEVRIQRRGERFSKYFSDLSHGGKRLALQSAKVFRDEIDQRYKRYSVKDLAAKPSARNRSGQVGIRLHEQTDRRGEFDYSYWYWIAQWTDGHGRRRTRSFSIHRHGEEEAYRLACEARNQGIKQAKR